MTVGKLGPSQSLGLLLWINNGGGSTLDLWPFPGVPPETRDSVLRRVGGALVLCPGPQMQSPRGQTGNINACSGLGGHGRRLTITHQPNRQLITVPPEGVHRAASCMVS